MRQFLFNARTVPIIGEFLTSEKQKKSNAYHEAGHALAAILLDYGKELQTVTLEHSHNSFGAVTTTNKDTHIDIEQAKNWMICELAGEAAENLLAGTPYKKRFSALYDHKIARKIAKEIMRHEGGHNKDTLIATKQQRAHKLMENNRDKLDKIADALLKQETLSAKEIYQLADITQP